MDVHAGFILLVVPVVALVWPILALSMPRIPGWRPWAFGGCLVLGVFLTTLATWMGGDLSGGPGLLPLLPLAFWLLGAFNLAAATIVLVVFYREWSWRVTLAVVVIAVGMVAASTKAGMVMATWPRLPGPAIPHDGQITGVVGEPTLYGWRRLEPHRRLDVVVAVPAPSFRLFRARDLRRAHEGPPEPPVHGLEVRRDDLVDVEGVRIALIPGDAIHTRRAQPGRVLLALRRERDRRQPVVLRHL